MRPVVPLCGVGASRMVITSIRFRGGAYTAIECEDANQAIRANTRAYNATLERLILRHPEQWFWVHRRWKSAEQNRSAVR